MSTEATLAHHLQAILQQNVNEIMRDYTEQSALFTQSGVIVGLEGIGAFYKQFLGGMTPELFAALQIVRQDIHDEVAYLIWKAEPFVTLATDSFLVRDGTIIAQTFVMLAPQPA